MERIEKHKKGQGKLKISIQDGQRELWVSLGQEALDRIRVLGSEKDYKKDKKRKSGEGVDGVPSGKKSKRESGEGGQASGALKTPKQDEPDAVLSGDALIGFSVRVLYDDTWYPGMIKTYDADNEEPYEVGVFWCSQGFITESDVMSPTIWKHTRCVLCFLVEFHRLVQIFSLYSFCRVAQSLECRGLFDS